MILIAVAAAICAALTRSIGVTLLFAIGIHWLLERRFAPVLAFTVTSIGTVALWLFWTAGRHEQFIGRSYIADFAIRDGGFVAEFSSRIFDAIRYLTSLIPYLLTVPTMTDTLVDNIIGATVITVGISIGLLVLFWRFRPVALYVLLYGILLALWPYKIGRFVIPLLPLLVPALLLGIETSVRRFKPHWATAVAVMFAVILLVNSTIHTAILVKEKATCERGFESAHRCFDAQEQSRDEQRQQWNDEAPYFIGPQGEEYPV